MTETWRCTGTVREWHDDDGWGVLDCAELDSPCWAHYSALEMDGYHRLTPGAEVTAVIERVEQDGYHYRAVSVTPHGPTG
jgi:CspA family cold shock protein